MTFLIIIIGVILAAILIGAAAYSKQNSSPTAIEWVKRNFIDKDIL